MQATLRAGAVLATATLLASLIAAAPASASLVPHGLVGSITGSGPDSLSNPRSVAVDNSAGPSAGDVYVTDPANFRVEKFDAAGNFLLMFGHNVNAGSGNPDVCTNAGPPTDVCQSGVSASILGAPPAGFRVPAYIAVDSSSGPSAGDVYIADVDTNVVQKFDPSGNLITAWGGTPAGGQLQVGSFIGLAVDSAGNLWTGGSKFAEDSSPVTIVSPSGIAPGNGPPPGFAVDASGNFYEPGGGAAGGTVMKNYHFSVSKPGTPTGVAIDPSTQDLYVANPNQIGRYRFSSTYAVLEPDSSICTLVVYAGCDPTESFGLGALSGVQGLAIDAGSGKVYVADTNHHRIAVFGPATLPDLTTGNSPSGFVPDADVTGHIDLGGGSNVTDCYFQYGTTVDYELGKVPCTAGSFGGYPYTGSTDVDATLTGLSPAVTYHYQLVATTSQGTNFSSDQTVVASGPPEVSGEAASGINTDSAFLRYRINPNGASTTYRLEYGLGDCSVALNCTNITDGDVGNGGSAQSLSFLLGSLAEGTTYHYRIVAQNARGITKGDDHTLTTYVPPPGDDPCPNSHVRQQTGAFLLSDCRAYELVSATYTGGYDVESDTVPGRTPLTAYPSAPSRVLYAIHQGSIPGIAGSPTNFGRDPYVATRGADGWRTTYVGLPASGMAAAGVFGSPLLGADSSLIEFAFGGQGICDPCFADGSTNVPLRLTDGSLVKGMAGSLNPAGDPAGTIAKPFSADGSHFVFGSTSKFESGGNSNGTDATIYDRDLKANATQVVSTLPNAATIAAGSGVAELDVSTNGSRIVIGKLVSTDAAGNPYYHLYMHLGTNPATVDLASNASDGVLFDGMSSDGSKVFFTTADQLAGSGDTDNSPDLYEADVSAGGALTLHLVSVGSGGPVNSDSCNPVANSDGDHWNAIGVASTASCGPVAFAGGAGVATGDGTIYFLSPERLDGNGASDAPNLFVKRPGLAPKFIAALEPDSPALRSAVSSHYVHSFGDIQVTSSGDFAAFASDLSLTGFPNFGHSEIYRYDAPGVGHLDCASCAPSGAAATSDATLTPTGLNLTDDGRVFFTTSESLALRDTSASRDVYEWEHGEVQLVSTGASLADSGLVTVSPDGVDAYFFTRDVLAVEDHNGSAIKIYDARAEGGFPSELQPVPCQASDECHGAGTQEAPPAAIGTFEGTGGQYRPLTEVTHCRNNKVRRRGRCVKRHRHRKTHHRPGGGR